MSDFAVEKPYAPRRLEDMYLDDWPPILSTRRDGLPPHVSPSQLKQFARCPEQFRRVRVLGEREPPSAAILWGSADHSTMEANFRHKLNHAEDLPIGDVQYRFAELLEQRVEREGGIYEVKWGKETDAVKEPTGADARKAFGSVKDRGVALVTAYRQQVAPEFWPTRVEHDFLVDVTGLPVPLAGVIDAEGKTIPEQLALEHGPDVIDVEPEIIERKTTGKTDMNGEWLIQARTYQLVVPRRLQFHLSVKPRELKDGSYGSSKIVAGDPPGTPEAERRFSFDPQPAPMVATQIKRLMAGIAYCFHTYGPDQPWPDAIPHPWSCGYCGFRPTCPWWNGSAWA
ncbi:MAG TPA: PD-(D/E)XK nuclease family protein [Acidimicrobiales bacterium]|jgi:hypothetical protein|nr:PD-(D/E)XK nuclease family protein [Acidimicrobiales bacterium]